MNRIDSTSDETATRMAQYENMQARLREIVIEAIAESMSLYGVTPSNARLYGALLFSEKPMTLDEMGNALAMSKTSMSTGVRALLHLKMVNKIWVKGARKDHYEIEKDWHQNFIDYFDVEWRDTARNCIKVLSKSLNELKAFQKNIPHSDLSNRINNDMEKIEYALEYYDWLIRLIDFFKTNEIFKYVPKKEAID